MSQDLVPHGSDGTSEPGANSKSGPCAMVDGFRRMLGSWKREGYRLKFRHRHTPRGACRVMIEVSEDSGTGGV